MRLFRYTVERAIIFPNRICSSHIIFTYLNTNRYFQYKKSNYFVMCSLHIYYRSRFSIKFEFFLSYYIEIKEKYLNMTKSSTIPLHHRTKFTIVQTKLFHPIYNIKPNSGEYQTVNYDLTIAIWTDKSTARKTTHVSKAKTTHISRPEYIRNKTSAPF